MEQKFSRREFLKIAGVAAAAEPLRRLGLLGGEGHPLSPEEEQRLYEVSLTYLAPTMAATIEVAKRINFKPENEFEWPDNMCGPLAIDQLIKAGLLPETTRVADFWLLEPKRKKTLLEKTFPKDRYTWSKTATPMAEFDFAAQPLYPGDFIYTYGGTFTHMFTVTRVDEANRAYTVTNLNAGIKGKYGKDEFVIGEVLLYDPADREAGLFHDWAYGKDRYRKGYTGTAGFSLWRRRAAQSEASTGEFGAELKNLLARSGGEWYVAIRDISEMGDRDIYFQEENAIIHPASTIKVAIAMAFFDWLERQGVTEIDKFLQKGPGSGRSYSQLLQAMLVKSEEAATATLTEVLERKLPAGIAGVLREWGLDQTTVTPRRTTAKETMMLLENLYRGKLVTVPAREKILSWLSEYTSGDEGRIGVVKNELPAGWQVKVYNKRGSIAQGMTVVADAAIIEFTRPDSTKKAYVVEFFGYPGDGTTYESLEKTIEEATKLFGETVVAGMV